MKKQKLKRQLAHSRTVNEMLSKQNLRLLTRQKRQIKFPQSNEKRFRTIQRTVSKLQQEISDKNVIIACLRGEK